MSSSNNNIDNKLKTSNLRVNLSENPQIINPLHGRKMMYLPKSQSPCNIDTSDNKIRK
jgi:hypothetical protein